MGHKNQCVILLIEHRFFSAAFHFSCSMFTVFSHFLVFTRKTQRSSIDGGMPMIKKKNVTEEIVKEFNSIYIIGR